MSKALSEGYSGFMHLVERRMLFHDEIGKLVRKNTPDDTSRPFKFITISRDIGALGGAIASELARQFQWKVYDKEIVDYIAKHNHVLYDLVNQLDEKTQSHIQDSIERLMLTFHRQGFSNDVYHISLIQALAALAGQGECIILGHGGAYALQEQPGLHIRITASFPVRIRRVCQRWDISREQAEKLTRRTDRQRADFIRHHFMADPGETKYFHVVFNTDKLSIGVVSSAIADIMRRKKNHPGLLPESPVGAPADHETGRIPA